MNPIPLEDIKQDSSDVNPSSKKPVDDVRPPQKKPDQFYLSIQENRKKQPSKVEEDNPPSKTKKHKSPRHKLIAFFEKSRDNWKNKCSEAKEALKLANKNVKNLRESKRKLKKKIKSLKSEVLRMTADKEALEQEVQKLNKAIVSHIDDAQKLNLVPSRHQYPIWLIYMYISLVLTASTSLRGASKAIEVFNRILNLDYPIPSWPSGRLWLLRLGYYKLMRPKEKADDWIYVVDHLIQLDNKKCLVISGIRQAQLLNFDRALTYEDMEPLAILPVNESNGKMVCEQLEQTAEKTGIPRAIVGDYGSDLKKGIDEFCNKYPQTAYIHDIKHKTALILKHELAKDKEWQEFNKLLAETKQAIKQTPLGFLNPRKSRTKARYMNVDTSIIWGIDVLNFLEEQAKNPSKEFDQKIIEKKLGWIRSYKESLKEWQSMLNVVSTTEQLIREHGIRTDSHILVQEALLKIVDITARIKNVKKELLNFIKLESLKATFKEKLLGSSEVIESLFGKLKEVEKGQSQSGFTGLVLVLAAMVSTTSIDVVTKALETVQVSTVIDWCKEHIGESVQSKRKNFLKGSKRGTFPQGYKKREQKRGKLLLPI